MQFRSNTGFYKMMASATLVVAIFAWGEVQQSNAAPVVSDTGIAVDDSTTSTPSSFDLERMAYFGSLA